MSNSNRREFVKMIGFTALSSAVMSETIAKAQRIPANNQTGTIQDVQNIVILMQENRPFDHHFGTLQGVRGFNDPRAINIKLPLSSGTGSTPVPVFLQPAGASNIKAGFAVAPDSNNLGGPADGVDVVPPYRVNPADANPGQMMLGLTYFAGTSHAWKNTQTCWNLGQHDSWASENGYETMSYMTREDLPYHYALADAYTVGDAYHFSLMGPTNPNRMYLWTGCVGNVSYLGAGGSDGDGYGPVTGNGLSPNNAYYVWETFPETLQAAGITWKIYQTSPARFSVPISETARATALPATTPTIPCFTSNSTRRPLRARRCTTTPAPARRSSAAFRLRRRPRRPGRPGPRACSPTSPAT